MDRGPLAPRTLRAGPVSLVFEAGALRWLTLGGTELIRGIYVAVRDDRWGTVPGVLEDLRVVESPDAFDVSFVSHHRRDDIDFSWHGRMMGATDGSIEVAMDGVAGSTFRRNRIGICMLHPMELAGSPMRVMHPAGTQDGMLPELISPVAPFLDVTQMRWLVTDDLAATVGLEGDLFEMEDQRNWTDASFKTFSTPLRLPYPVTIERGTPVRQRLTLRLDGPAAGAADAESPRTRARATAPAQGVDLIEVHEAMGPMPTLGTALAPGRERLDPAELDALRELGPAIIRSVLELDDPGWPSALADARATTRAVGARLEVEVVAGDHGAGLEELVADLAGAPGQVDQVWVFPTSSYATTALLADRLRGLMSSGGPWPLVGGGSRANFAELNRSEVVLDTLDAIGFPICPEVHTFDDASVIENIAAQPVAIRTAQARTTRPLTVGPITLLPRFQAYGESRPAYGLANEAERDDPRQGTSFAAAWTIGSLAGIVGSDVATVLLHEATGPAGIIDAGGGSRASAARPVYAALRGVMPMRGAVAYRSTAAPGLAALAFRTNDGDRLMVANLRPEPRTVELRLPRPAGHVAIEAPGVDAVGHADGGRSVRLEMGAYGVIRVDATPTTVHGGWR